MFRVKQIAEKMPVAAYSESALRAALPKLRAFLLSPEEIRHVPKILAECGVRFVIVEHVPSSRIDGVCFWLDRKTQSPVIGMSLRLKRIDNFWFVLRHEIEHVLRRHGREEAIVDRDFDRMRAGKAVAQHYLRYSGSIHHRHRDLIAGLAAMFERGPRGT